MLISEEHLERPSWPDSECSALVQCTPLCIHKWYIHTNQILSKLLIRAYIADIICINHSPGPMTDNNKLIIW